MFVGTVPIPLLQNQQRLVHYGHSVTHCCVFVNRCSEKYLICVTKEWPKYVNLVYKRKSRLSSRAPPVLILGLRPPWLLNVAYNGDPARAEIRPPPGHMRPFSCQAGREHERLSARPQQTIPLCTQKAKNLRFRKEAETRMDTRCQIC